MGKLSPYLNNRIEWGFSVNFHLGICPPWHLDHHVISSFLLGIQGNVVEGRDWSLIILDKHLEGVGVGLSSGLNTVS